MADAVDDDDEIFIYMGGNQRVPDGVRRVRIHKSVKIIPARAFQRRRNLISVEFHDEIEIIEEGAFAWCNSLRGPIKLLGIRIVKKWAFNNCFALPDVKFGHMLERIEKYAFNNCISLRSIKMSSVRTIGERAFAYCHKLSDVEFGEDLETIAVGAFNGCPTLKRIVLPLKDDMIDGNVFLGCPKLVTVELVGGIHNTVASLHMETWRTEMMYEITGINQVLPNTDVEQETEAILRWMRSVIHQLNHYKAEHNKVLKEATTLLELALWKANLDSNKGEREGVRTTRGRRKRARKEISVTSGASIVIKNVLPFLILK